MFGVEHYVPILKGKQGEVRALSHLTDEQRTGLTPLVEIRPVDLDDDAGAPTGIVEEHLEGDLRELARAWGSASRIFIDPCFLDLTEDRKDGRSNAEALPGLFDASGLRAVLVVRPAQDDRYYEAARATMRGACLRLAGDDLLDDAMGDRVRDTVDALGMPAGDVDLVIDLGGDMPPTKTAAAMAQAVLAEIPYPQRWRTVTLAATSFPRSLSMLELGASTLDRTEWAMWRRVGRSTGISRLPTFGDYGIAHPELFEGPAGAMRPVASIRYTVADRWLILKGVSVRGRESPGFGQFHALAHQLVEHPLYAGRSFSWGDDAAWAVADRRRGPGNLTTWREIGTNHHLMWVMAEIATLRGAGP